MTGSRFRDTFIHIEPSSRCTLECPQCPRTVHSVRYENSDCDIETMVRCCRGYKEIILCGNHGDPIYHPRFHDLIRLIREDNPDAHFHIDTNGAFRSESWWEDTAILLGDGDTITFSIDGLPRNNHMYRVNSRWDGIEAGIRVLRKLSPDLHMRWKWIVFRYNQGDVVEGMRLAHDLGFDSFKMVYSTRYGIQPESRPTKDYEDVKQEITRWVESYRNA